MRTTHRSIVAHSFGRPDSAIPSAAPADACGAEVGRGGTAGRAACYSSEPFRVCSCRATSAMEPDSDG